MTPTRSSPALPVRILFNRDVPHAITADERSRMLAACRRAEIVEIHGDADGERNAGIERVNVLVTDQLVPRDLGPWPGLQWVQLLSAGANQLMGNPLATSAIPVTTCSGLHGVPIAQFVTGTLLMLAHHLPESAVCQSRRQWPADRWALRGTLLRGATAGIVGYGSIGRECARQLSALGMRILCADPAGRRDEGYNFWPGTGDAEGTLPERWFQPEQVGEMLTLCDVVVVAAPYTPKTAGMIGGAELARVKRGARIIVISRGGIVDESALAEGLRDGRIGGAVVDCFVKEPPPSDHPFFDAPNIILTPHVAGAYEGFWQAMIGLFTENLRRFDAGLPLLNQANKQLGY